MKKKNELTVVQHITMTFISGGFRKGADIRSNNIEVQVT